MKRSIILSLFFAAAMLSACSDKASTDNATTSTATNNTDQGKQMLEDNRKVLKAIETGDSATIRRYVSEDAVDHGAGENGADIKGPEIIRSLTDVHNHVDNLKFEVLQEAANGDHIFCLARMTGKIKDAVWGMPAGMQADLTSVDVIRIKDGKMVEHWNYMSPADMMKMMPPASGAAAKK